MAEVLPTLVAVRFAHASLQVLAELHEVEVLHIKGPAVDPALLDVQEASGGPEELVDRQSTDADVFVNPRQMDRMLDIMVAHGWTSKLTFVEDSAFAHAAVLYHPMLGSADVHRSFPGIGLPAPLAFERMWRDRTVKEIAGYRCWVPSLAAQRLLLVLHAVRSRGARHEHDLRRAWAEATGEEKAVIDGLAAELRADVALAAGTGRLDQYEGHREHQLWRLLASDERASPLMLWAARVRASGTLSEALRTAVRLALPNRGHLHAAQDLKPGRGALLGPYIERVRLGATEFWKLVRGSKR